MQVTGMFDCPIEDKSQIQYRIDFPFDEQKWNVGLIVGPSGSGKTTIAKSVFGEPIHNVWQATSVIDDFDKAISVEKISASCQAVGFNTIPAWTRPFSVLSNGEKFRVDMARTILEIADSRAALVDEFTSVVDRQTAKIVSACVQKHVRKNNKQLVAVSCHYDIVDWLQPDWVLDMATQSFTRRLLRRRPDLDIVIGRVPYSAWKLFAPFHYMSADLNKSAKCFGLWCNGVLASFTGVLHFPHPLAKNIKRDSRSVTLPDYQGLGLNHVMAETLGAAYKTLGFKYRRYPGHPALIRSMAASDKWAMKKKPGEFSPPSHGSASFGNRACAVFEYVGDAMSKQDAMKLIG